jgi:hypothetical protein
MTRNKRLLWIVNHGTLMQAEVPIFLDLGFEVFIPKIIPDHDPSYRSGVVSFEYDSSLSLSHAAMTVLNTHDFYQRTWSPTLVGILNEHFDVVVCSVSAYLTPLSESVPGLAKGTDSARHRRHGGALHLRTGLRESR